MSQLRDHLTSSLLGRDPCHFPRLRSDHVVSRLYETYSSLLSLPQPVVQPGSATPVLSQNDWCTLTFALLLKAYIRTDSISCGLFQSSGSNSGAVFKVSSACLITAEFDVSVSISDNFRRLKLTPLNGSHKEIIGRDLRELEDQAGFKYFNTSLCFSDVACGEQLLEDPFDSDLVLHVQDGYPAIPSNNLKVSLQYRTSHLDSWCAQNVVATFQSILSAISADVEGLLSRLSLISTRDMELIYSWNAKLPPPANQTLNERFEKVFHDNAHKEAVYTSDGCFTYEELDDLSTVLAVQLAQLGVKRNIIVPICMEKSRWATCAMVAVWKSGGALTTMDPTYPDDRLLAIVEEVGARIVISDVINAERFEKAGYHTVSNLKDLSRLLGTNGLPVNRADAWRMGGVEPDDLAFVAFTSGSTGRPKGVMHTHNRLTSEHLSYIWNSEYNCGARILQFGSYAFIAGVGDNFRAMLHGATLCVPSESERTSSLAEFINRSQSTRSYMTPTVVRTLDPKKVPSLKHLCVGGEPLGRDLEKIWAGRVHFIQLYGASEGGFMIKDASNPKYNGHGLFPIGGLSWLVDPQDVNRLVPIGAVGEIVFESHELATGYINDPDKTAKIFISPPIWAQKRATATGCRYLRMGDLGKYEIDGSLSIYGRADAQIKIHGQRVEPGDIEFKLRDILPPNSEVVVDLVRPIDAADRPLLTAFCRLTSDNVSNPGTESSFNSPKIFWDAQKKLGNVLPRHMVPRVFLIMKELPQGAKIDRRKLRTDAGKVGYKALLASLLPADNDSFEPPIDEKERILVELWANVLRQDVEHIGRRSNFLTLGGDSLTAIRLVSSAREKKIELKTQDILRCPVLKDMSKLATALEADGGCIDVAGGVDHDAACSTDPLTLRPTDFQEWAVRVGAFNGGWIDHLSFDFRGQLDLRRLEESCKGLVAAHPILKAVFEFSDDQICMRISQDQVLPFEIHKVTVDEIESKSHELYAKDRVCPFGSPIVRFSLLKASPSRHRLILRISHAQYDGFCAHTFGETLRLIYISLPIPHSLPFHKYATAVQDPSFIQTAETYWRTRLTNSQMPILVQKASSGPPFNKILDGEYRESVLEPKLRHHGISVATAVKVAWALTISSLSRSDDVVFGDFISGRQVHIPGIETVVGPCVNFMPVRVHLLSNMTNIELLRTVQDDLVSSIPHESLGFKHIMHKCTNWGLNERFSSIVNFVNVENASFGTETWIDNSENRLEVESIYEEKQHDKTDLWLLCLPEHLVSKPNPETKHGEKTLELHFRFNTHLYPTSAIERISGLFCEALYSLSTVPDQLISIPRISDEERSLLVPTSD